jgi:hypothetical protein
MKTKKRNPLKWDLIEEYDEDEEKEDLELELSKLQRWLAKNYPKIYREYDEEENVRVYG